MSFGKIQRICNDTEAAPCADPRRSENHTERKGGVMLRRPDSLTDSLTEFPHEHARAAGPTI